MNNTTVSDTLTPCLCNFKELLEPNNITYVMNNETLNQLINNITNSYNNSTSILCKMNDKNVDKILYMNIALICMVFVTFMTLIFFVLIKIKKRNNNEPI